MPPSLDIYGLTKHRNFVTINHFIDAYVDRASSEDRGDEELMIVPLGRTRDSWKYMMPKVHAHHLKHNPSYATQYYEYEWEPAFTLSHSIQRGLDYPRRSFSIYLTSKVPDISQAILSFTVDDLLILGLSIDDEGALPENQLRAEKLLESIARQYDCHLGLIRVDQPPPMSEAEFHELRNNTWTTLFQEFKRGQST